MSYKDETEVPSPRDHDNDSPNVQILEAVEEDDECEMIVDGKVVKLPAKKKKKRVNNNDKSEDMMAFLERKRL